MPKPKKWSYSRWSMYHACPAQYEWHYVLRMPRESSPALERGIDIHKKAENFVNGKIKGLPDCLKKFAKEFKVLKKEFKKGNGFTEPDISMNKDRSASTKFETDYFIGFADYAHFFDIQLTVIDYKTGRKYPGHKEQGCIYSLILLCLNPGIDEVMVEFWYLDSGEVTEFKYHRNDLERLLAIWDKRINKMYADKKFTKTPHKFCKWCAKYKAGECNG